MFMFIDGWMMIIFGTLLCSVLIDFISS